MDSKDYRGMEGVWKIMANADEGDNVMTHNFHFLNKLAVKACGPKLKAKAFLKQEQAVSHMQVCCQRTPLSVAFWHQSIHPPLDLTAIHLTVLSSTAALDSLHSERKTAKTKTKRPV